MIFSDFFYALTKPVIQVVQDGVRQRTFVLKQYEENTPNQYRKRKFYNLDDFCDYVERFGDPMDASIYINENAITFVRKEEFAERLPEHPVFDFEDDPTLARFQNAGDQRMLIRLMEQCESFIVGYDEKGMDRDIVMMNFRKLQLGKSLKVVSDINQQGAAEGIKIAYEVENTPETAQIPRYWHIDVPIFKNMLSMKITLELSVKFGEGNPPVFNFNWLEKEADMVKYFDMIHADLRERKPLREFSIYRGISG